MTRVDPRAVRATAGPGLRRVALVGVPFLWLGMVAAISLFEAPLKFQADGVSREEALAIGQLVFPALNAVEVVLASAVVVLMWPWRRSARRTWGLALATAGVLLVQVALVRPILHASTVAVLSGESAGGSSWHLVYVALEGLKIVLLLVLGYATVGVALGSEPGREPAAG